MIPLLLRERHKVYRLLAPERVEGVGRGGAWGGGRRGVDAGDGVGGGDGRGERGTGMGD